MKITAEEITVNDLFSRATLVFKVPVYQRPYSWGKEQWEELWDDLCELENDDTHYLGSIVVVSDALKVAGFDRLEVVDGQQRLWLDLGIFTAP